MESTTTRPDLVDTFVDWLASNPSVIAFVVAVLVLGVPTLFVCAFLQGRDVAFWPPKIGPRPGRTPPRGGALTPKQLEGHSYFFPSTLIEFVHEETGLKDEIDLRVLRVSTIAFLEDGPVTVRTSMASTGVIREGKSISAPSATKHHGLGGSAGGTKTTFIGAKKDGFDVLVTESTRTFTIGAERAQPEEDDDLLRELYQRALDDARADFAGNRITAPTERVRLLLYFPPGRVPNTLYPMSISRKGAFSKSGFRTKLYEKRCLWVVETDTPPLDSGVFATWVWPEA